MAKAKTTEVTEATEINEVEQTTDITSNTESVENADIEEIDDIEELEEEEEEIEIEEDKYTTELKNLTTAFAGVALKKKIVSPVYMAVKDLRNYPRIKEVLTKVCEYLEIPLDAPFLKFKCSQDGFKGLVFPAIGSHNGKVAANLNNQIHYLDKAWAKKLLRFKKENNFTFMTIHDSDITVSDVRFPLYLHDAKLPASKLVNYKVASEYLVPLLFNATTFEDGEYPVKSFSKKENRCTANILYKNEITNIYLGEYDFKNLCKARDAEQDLVFVIDGYKMTKKGEYRNTYIKGFPPLNYGKLPVLVQMAIESKGYNYTLEELIFDGTGNGINKEGGQAPGISVTENNAGESKPAELDLNVIKEQKRISLEKSKEVFPIEFGFKGLQEVEINVNNPLGVMLILELDKVLYHVGLNSGMKRDYKNGLFNLHSFDDCKLIITSIGKWKVGEKEHFTFKHTWSIPTDNFDTQAMDDLSNLIFPDLEDF